MKDKIKKLLDNCTSGLQGDTELQLDVQAELKNHILERMDEEQEKGADEEKSLENALKAFGDAPEIADGIVDANKKRMNLRAKLRIAAMYLIIPLSVIAAVISVDLEALTVLNKVSYLGGGGSDFRTIHELAESIINFKKAVSFGIGEIELKGKGKVINDIGSEVAANNASEEYQKLVDKYPNNRIFRGNYITKLTSEMSNPSDSGKWEECISELRKAEKLDPENARYNYILASYYCEQGCEIDYKEDEKGIFKVKDRKMLDKGMAELKKAMAKPYLKSYSDDLLKKQLAIMGEPETFAEHIEQLSMAAGVLFPGLSKYRDLASISPHYAEILINENRKEEALPYLGVWKIMGNQLNNDSWTLIEVLVACAIFEANKEMIPELYKKSGHPELAEIYLKEQEIISELARKWKERRNFPEMKEIEKNLKKSAGILVGMLLPILGEKIDLAELEANRTLDYIILEKFVLGSINIFIMFLMIGCLIVILKGKFFKGERSSILLMPDLGKIGEIFLYCVIVPVIVYYVASRLPFIGGRDYNVKFNVIKCSIQLITFFIAILVIPVEATSMYVRKRFKAFNLSVPKEFFTMRGKVFRAIFGITLALALCPAFIFHSSNDLAIFPLFYVSVVLALVFMNLLVRLIASIFCKNEYSCYFSSVAKTLIPVFGGTAILLVAISKPYISTQETYLVQNDPLMRIDMENLSFTSVEGRVTQRLRNEIKEAEKKIKRVEN